MTDQETLSVLAYTLPGDALQVAVVEKDNSRTQSCALHTAVHLPSLCVCCHSSGMMAVGVTNSRLDMSPAEGEQFYVWCHKSSQKPTTEGSIGPRGNSLLLC